MGSSLISNPPYNMRWEPPQLAGLLPQYSGWPVPPKSNANYAFILSGLNLAEDRAVFLLPNGVLTSDQQQERRIRERLVRENLLLAVITLPGRMFESTSIPTSLLVFDRHKETRRIAMVDLKDACREETREQRGQFGGASHTGRTYHKVANVVPEDIMRRVTECIDTRQEHEGLCTWITPEQVVENDYSLVPGRFLKSDSTGPTHRAFSDIASDYNRIIAQKNAIRIRMNRTAAKRLGYDCMDTDRPDLSRSFAVVGQTVEKEDFISFGADDGIRITVSTKEGIHPLIMEFLSHWKQMIMYLNNEENRVLAEFRDALLPELMSGKISV